MTAPKPVTGYGWNPAFTYGENMLQSEAMKQNITLNPPHNPHQDRSKSSEFTCNTNISGDESTSNTDTTIPIIPASLHLYHIVSIIQYIYGLRISEVLSIRNGDVTKDGFVLISGKKGSNNRIIYTPELLPIIHPNPLYEKTLIFPFSYSQYRRVCLLHGIYLKPTGSRKRKIVSHLYRHNRLKAIYNLTGEDLKQTKQFSGQKNNISALHYIKST